LTEGLTPGIPVHILEPNQDGIQRITQVIAKSELSTLNSLTIHIVSHGDPGTLYLGNRQLNLSTLNHYVDDLRTWFSAASFSSHKSDRKRSLHLYGCNVAATDVGIQFLTQLSHCTGATIHASSTAVGNSAHGGNWELDVTVPSPCRHASKVASSPICDRSNSPPKNATAIPINHHSLTSLIRRSTASLGSNMETAIGRTAAIVRSQSSVSSFLSASSVFAFLTHSLPTLTMNANSIFSADALAKFPGVLSPDGGGFGMAPIPSPKVSNPTNELVVIDAGVADKATLIADFESRGVDYIVLDGNSDGIQQITQALGDRTDLDALHIISHGSEGQAHLGNTVLSEDTLDDYSDELADWGDALGAEADILFYGCNLAEGPGGASFINEISALTGADVAASDDLTGAAHLGGDFDLEVRTGSIEADIALSSAAQATFDEVLSPGGVSTGLNVWLKADDGVLTGDGTAVSAWTDQSAAGNTVDQTNTGEQPRFYSTTESELLNFNPSLSFDGGDDLQNGLNFGDDRFLSNTSAYTIFGVAQDERTNLAELRAVFAMGDNGNDPAFDLQTDGVSPNGLNVFFDGSNPVEGSTSHLLYNGNTGGSNVQPQIFGISSPNTAGGTDNVTVYVDGNAELTNQDSAQLSTIGQNFWVGSSDDARWLGNIGEVIVFDRELTTAETQQVQSYLAVKYGVTLGQTGPQNYVTSSGATIWDGTANAAYHNDVAVIGRDDGSVLDQQKSKSVNEGTVVTIDNGGAFATDESFLAWGNNGQAANYSTNYAPGSFTPAAGYFRMDRVWTVQETGSVNTVTVENADADHLLVSNDPTFATGVTELALSGGSITYDFSNGQYFTFGKELTAPGGVTGNLEAWVKADAGTNTTADGAAITTWEDQSLSGNDFFQATANRQPEYQAASADFNFNAALNFNPAGTLQADFSQTESWGDNDGTIYVIYNQEQDGAWRTLVDVGLTAGDTNSPQFGMTPSDVIGAWYDISGGQDDSPFAVNSGE
ncbi:MAG: DUF4347 domain-containing protein, partial [Bacteroidota bacterium]